MWAKSGYVVANEQFSLNVRPAVADVNTSIFGVLKVSEQNNHLLILGNGFSASFTKSTGVLISLRYNAWIAFRGDWKMPVAGLVSGLCMIYR